MQAEATGEQASTVTSAVRTLLELHPAEVAVNRTLVLTVEPAPWLMRSVGTQMMVADLSTMLQLRPPGVSESEREAEVVERLVAAGWPQSWIVRRYRPRMSVRTELDIAVRAGDGELILAIEVKPSRLGQRCDRTGGARLVQGAARMDGRNRTRACDWRRTRARRDSEAPPPARTAGRSNRSRPAVRAHPRCLRSAAFFSRWNPAGRSEVHGRASTRPAACRPHCP